MYRYKLETIKRISPLDGSNYKLWYEYIIKNQVNTITGCKAGSYKSVYDFTKDCIDRLNLDYAKHKYRAYSPVSETAVTHVGAIRVEWQ